MLIIRLQRTGSRNHPAFRIVLTEKHRAAKKKALKVLGAYNPVSKKLELTNKEELLARLQQNVAVSPTVHNLLISKNIIQGKKVRAWRPKRKSEEKSEAEKPAEPADAPAQAKTEPEQATEKKPEKTDQPEEKAAKG